MISGRASATAPKENGFGALRLLFAFLVILSHSPEMADGDRHREILTSLFGTISFGEIAVDGFFVISGYLITSSMLSNCRGFLKRRIMRIYPGFLAASIICLLIVGPLGGAALATLPPLAWGTVILHAALMHPPVLSDVFMGSNYPALNGSMWTIRYEFGCYLLTYALGRAGLLGRKRVLLAITALVVLANLWSQVHPLPHLSGSAAFLLGQPKEVVRLLLAYLAGSCFRVFSVRFRKDTALAASVLLVVALFSPLLAETALILLGGYTLFFPALHFDNHTFRTINARDDISYGVYLYAWPIGKLLFWYFPGLNVWIHVIITVILSAGAGWCSWKAIESPVMRLGRASLPAVPSTGDAGPALG